MPEKLAIDGGAVTFTGSWPKWPIFDSLEEEKIIEAVRSGKWWYVGATKVLEFEKAFQQLHSAKYATAVTNGSHAIEVALRALGIGCGDEAIVPAYTFVATASSVLAVSATPVFVDIQRATLNIDPDKIEAAITDRTRAIIPVHIGGSPADLDRILEIAKKHDLFVIEDAAQAVCAEWKGVPVGAIGDCGTFSFQASKNLNCGEGGVVISNNEDLADKIWSVTNVGRTRHGKKYEQPILGSNYRMTEFQAAILLAQMTRLEEQCKTRSKNAMRLTQLLQDINGIHPIIPDSRVTRSAYHLFCFRYEASSFGERSREEFIRALIAEGIPADDGYSPLYREDVFQFPDSTCKSDCSRTVGAYIEQCPETEDACSTVVWIPQYVLLAKPEDMNSIGVAIQKIQAAWAP